MSGRPLDPLELTTPVGDPLPIPAPPGRFPLGYALEMQRDVLGLSDRLSAEYGGLVRIPIPGAKIYLATDADLIQHLLVESERIFTKGVQNDRFTPLLGRGLVLSTGSHWKRQRRLMNPFFSPAAVTGFAQHIESAINDVVLDWERRGLTELDLRAEMKRITLRVILRSLFSGDGVQHADELFRNFNTLSAFCIRRFFSAMPLPLPLAFILQPAARSAMQSLKALLDELIDGRRREGTADKQDLLSMLIDARDEESGERMSNENIRDELMTIFFAGYDTTSIAMTMTLRLLSEHPEIRGQLEDEVDRNISQAIPTAEETQGLSGVTRAFQEAMRLYPPAYMVNRTPIEDARFGPYVLPAGAVILISIWGVHRSPRYWNDPLRFDPNRFLPENIAGRHRFAYVPFVGGPRVCIGKNLAMLEGPMILGAVLKNYRLSHRPDHVTRFATGSTLDLADGMPMRLEKRNA